MLDKTVAMQSGLKKVLLSYDGNSRISTGAAGETVNTCFWRSCGERERS